MVPEMIAFLPSVSDPVSYIWFIDRLFVAGLDNWNHGRTKPGKFVYSEPWSHDHNYSSYIVQVLDRGIFCQVVKVDGRLVGDGQVGPVTRTLQNAYKKLTEEAGVPIPTYQREWLLFVERYVNMPSCSANYHLKFWCDLVYICLFGVKLCHVPSLVCRVLTNAKYYGSRSFCHILLELMAWWGVWLSFEKNFDLQMKKEAAGKEIVIFKDQSCLPLFINSVAVLIDAGKSRACAWTLKWLEGVSWGFYTL